jgi:histidine kinase
LVSLFPACWIDREVIGFCDFFREYKQEATLIMTVPWLQLTQNLLGKSADPTRLTGESMNEDQYLQQYADRPRGEIHDEALVMLHYARMVLLYLFGELEQAEADRRKYVNYKNEMSTFFLRFYNLFFCGLTCLGMAHKGKRVSYYKRQARWYLAQLQNYAEAGSGNCVPMLALLRAEQLSISDKKEGALVEYEQAITMSGRCGFRLFNGIACERAGEYLIACGNEEKGGDYLQRAFDEYSDYGAVAKMQHMRAKYSGKIVFTKTIERDRRSSSKLQPYFLKKWKLQSLTDGSGYLSDSPASSTN